jgi:transposase
MAPMFAPVVDAMLAKLRSEQHWHADETRWAVFVPMEGKVGHRWYLWVYRVWLSLAHGRALRA